MSASSFCPAGDLSSASSSVPSSSGLASLNSFSMSAAYSAGSSVPSPSGLAAAKSAASSRPASSFSSSVPSSSGLSFLNSAVPAAWASARSTVPSPSGLMHLHQRLIDGRVLGHRRQREHAAAQHERQDHRKSCKHGGNLRLYFVNQPALEIGERCHLFQRTTRVLERDGLPAMAESRANSRG